MNNLHKMSVPVKGILLVMLAIAASLTATNLTAQTFPMPGFTLPAGKSIVITYEVDVDADVCPNGTAPSDISNQSNVSGSNFSTVQTDEVAGAPITPTLTPVAGLTLGNLVYKDNNKNGVFDAGDAGINGVALNLYADDGDGVLDAGDGAAITTTTTAGGGLYSFSPLCPGNYIVEVAASNFNSGQALYNNTLMSALISSPVGGAPDPDNDVNNDDNGDAVGGFGVASAAITLALGGEPITDGDADNNTNLTLDFGFKDPTTVTINDVTMAEGTGGSTTSFSFTVSRDNNAEAFSLTVNTADGTGTDADNDYEPISGGTVSFTAAGLLTQTVTVLVNHDNKVENNETFTVGLSGAPAGIIISDGTGQGTITNDDAATVTLVVPSLSPLEGNSGLVSLGATMQLDNPVQGSFMVTYTPTPGTATFTDLDFSGPTGTETFSGAAGQSIPVQISIRGDTKVELDETFTITLSISGAPAGVNAANSPSTVTITNDDAATVSLAGNVSQAENITPQVFTVNLSNPVDVPVTVQFSTSDGSAMTGDSDYMGIASQTVTFPTGTTTGQTVNVTITNDNKVESAELYNVAIGTLNAMGRNVSLGTSTGTGTITNDDNATVTLSGGGSDYESTFNSSKTFTATLNNPVQGGFSIAYNTNDGTATLANNDYQDNDGTLTFSGTANEMETFIVTIVNDGATEPDETFTTTLGAVSGTTLGSSITTAGSPQTYTILNDDQTVSVSVSPSSVLEDGPTNLDYTFTRTGFTVDSMSIYFSVGGTATFTTDYAQSGATFFNGTVGYVYFTFNQTSKVVTINPVADMTAESNETVVLTITPTPRFNIAPPGNATGTIEDDDNNVSVVVAPGTTAEDGSTNLVYTFTRTDVNTGALVVNFSVGGSAALTSDYTASGATTYTASSGTVTFSGVSPTATVTIDPAVDLIVEDNETVVLTVTGGVGYGVGSPSVATGTINNDDTATLTLAGGTSQSETNAGAVPYVFTATLSAAVQGGFTVPYTTNNGTATAPSDYTDNDGTLTFAGTIGETQNITVQANGDITVELNEIFTVALGAISGAPAGVTVAGSPQTATIVNDDAATVALAGNVSQAENLSPQVFTVTLSNPVDVNVTVQFSTADNTATTADNDYNGITNQTVTFLAGTTTSQTVNVTINNENKVEENEIFNVSLATLNAGGRNVSLGTSAGTGTIQNDDSATLTLTGGGSDNEFNSGQSGKIFTATLNNPVQGGFTLNFTTNNGTATAGSDYVDNDGSVAFAGTANEAKTITVNVNGDHQVETNETFTVNMNSLSNTTLTITLAGSPQTWTIVNDEMDYGDAPTSAQSGFPLSYKTFFSGGGDTAAIHNAVFGIHLGATIDGDTNGQPTANANGDDNTFLDDEDGVTLPAQFITGTTQTITVNASVVGYIHGWIDWTRDGYWNSGPEMILTNVPVVPGDNTFSISVPVGASVGTSFARFRFRTASGTLPPASQFGAADGEVEDYQVSIINNQYSISSPTVTEGNASTTNLTFVVSRTTNTTGGSVDYAITGGTATSGSDYMPLAAGTVNFTAGGTLSENVVVQVNGDLVVEDNETVIITLSNPVNGIIGTSPGTGTITNDDTATLTLSGGSSQTEGLSHTFTATLSAAVQGGFTVAYTTNDGAAMTADSDYTDNDNTLTFTGTANEQKAITVLTTTDNKVELNETFTENLGAIGSTTVVQAAAITVNGSPQTATIVNDDAATVSIAGNVSQAENLSPQVFTVTLSNPVDVAVTALFNTSNVTASTADNDYNAVTNQTVTFAVNTTTSQTVNVTINNDNKVENNEVYNVDLGSLNASGRNVSLGTSTGTGTIVNDDSAVVTLSGGGSANEGNTGTTPRVFTATLNNPVQGGFTVPYTTNDGTATAGSDYADNDGTLTFAGTAGEAQQITVLVNGDFFIEPNETFTVNLNSINGAPAGVTLAGSPQTGTITNDEVDYGDAPDTYATLLASNGARHNTVFGFRLGVAIDGDTDGQPTATANGDDSDAEGDDDDGVTLPSPLITNTTANVTVNATATGRLDGWVDFNNNGSFADAGEKVFNNVALVAGNNNLSFAVPNGATPAMTFARFRLSSAGGLSFNGAAADGEVEDYQVQIVNTQFSINDPTITEGNAGTTNLAFTITRSNNASACSVNYAITGGTAQTGGTSNTGGNDYQSLPAGTASFTAGGALTQTVNVVVNGDMTVELNETVVMTLSTPVNGTILDGSGTGTIVNDDSAVVTITSPSQAEGDNGNSTMTFNISMSNPADANVSFNFGTADGTATVADNDYIVISGSHTLVPGELTKQVFQAVVGDCKIEPDETFSVVLVSLANNGRNVNFSGGGATLSGTGTILNDDALPVITCPASFSQNTDPGVCSANVTLPLPTTSSVCGSSMLEFRYRLLSNSIFTSWIVSLNNTVVFPKGDYEIEWRVTDGSGSSSCTHLLSIVDNEAPMAVCKNITVQLNAAGMASITPAQVNNGSSDNCSFTLSLNITSFNCSNVGPNTVVLTATDPSNNSHACTATVTVQDNVAPVALCKNVTVQLDASGNGSITASQVNNGSSDACGIQTLSVTPYLFTCANVGANVVVLTVTDVNNNSASCNATITVQDNVAPVALCQSITITLNNDGTKTVAPSQINNGSSDACGIASLSLSPNSFSCNNIGVNNVTLTVTDVNGNSSTCTATVTVNEFVIITNVTSTAETCTGTGDGTITITATTLGGTLAYSVNGGATFQFSNFFNNLSPGVYNIVVKAQGTANCMDYATVTVGSGGSPQTWYLDYDNDGYSNGVTQTSCTQPQYYKLAANLTATNGDCDDTDPLEYPGQIWYKDADNDGYSNGTTMVSCTKPSGFKHASQLIQTSGDCNDANAAIRPGATETCNGIDDNCNGQVDEGLGNLVYNGNVVFSTQSQVNAWSQCYTVINGNLTVQNAGITNLSTLTNIVKVTGHVLIKLTSLSNLGGLVNLDSVGGNLTINNNIYGPKLTSLDGLDSLSSVGGNLFIFFNLQLSDCCAIHDLINTPGAIAGGPPSIYNNKTGCESIAGINNACTIINMLVLPPTITLWVEMKLNQQVAPGVVASYDPEIDQIDLRVNGHFSSGEARLLDESGRVVLKQVFQPGNSWFRMMLGRTTPGIYQLEITVDGNVHTQSINLQ